MSKRLTAEQVAAECKRLAWLLDTGGTISDTSEACGLRVASDLIVAHLVETDEQMRDRFERWWTARRIPMGYAPRLERDTSGTGYSFGNANTAWEAFQAALTWHGETEGGVE